MTIDLNDPQEFTIEKVRQLIASASDRTNVQLRVSKSGVAFISMTVGNSETDDLAFRLETFSAGSDHVGEAASQNDDWVKRVYDALEGNWPNPTADYIEFF